MSSWVYGNPAPPILRGICGRPRRKIRLVHGGIKETHVFHLHNHQWRLEADNPVSTIIDSITISPQECYTLDILYGTGSRNRVIGDVIFHCHLYPHFHERDVDVMEDLRPAGGWNRETAGQNTDTGASAAEGPGASA